MRPARSSKSSRVCAYGMASDTTSRPDLSGRKPLGGHRAKKRKFYIMTRMVVSRASGFELLNERTLFQGGPPIFTSPPGRRGFREYPEVPVFLSDSRLGRTHRDFEEYHGYWFISDRMKSVLECVDPTAFEFLKCSVQLTDGREGPQRWLCDVVRVLDALDEEQSEITIRTASDGTKVYNLFGGENFVFKEDEVGHHHVFRMMYCESTVICDEEMRRACKAAKLAGVRFPASL